MHRIDSPGSVSGAWVAGNPIAGVPGTVMDAAWFNAWQEEGCAVVEAELGALVKANTGQLLAAIRACVKRLSGAAIPFTAGGALLAGEGLLIEDTFGVVEEAAGLGDPAVLLVLGTHELAKAAVAVDQFERLYWDAGAELVTTVSAGNRSIGVAAVAALLGDATVFVRLQGPPNL